MRSDSRVRQATRRGARFVAAVLLIAPLLGTGVLTGCAPGSSLPVLPDPALSAYKLGPGDVVHVTTFGDADLSGDFRVSDAGRIEMPLVGSFVATGKTTDAMAAEISAALKDRKILNDPHVTLSVTGYRPIFVLGEVKNPGSFPYQPGMTVLTAVAVAGGYTYRAYDSYAEVVRNSDGTTTDARAMPQSLVEPGDVIRVLERNF